jgi:hypothetical protein
MDRNISDSVQEANELIQNPLLELAESQLAFVGGGIGDTAV